MKNTKQNEWMALDNLADAAECLRTLAHPMRLRMVEMLLAGEYNVGEIAEACGVQSHIASEHLGKMKDRGLLSCKRQSRAVYYSVSEPGLVSIMQCIRKRFG